MKKYLSVLIAVVVFFASIASLIYTVNEINTNGRYLDLTAFYPCNDITKNENNAWMLHFDGKKRRIQLLVCQSPAEAPITGIRIPNIF